jgi:hypothetical protein
MRSFRLKKRFPLVILPFRRMAFAIDLRKKALLVT